MASFNRKNMMLVSKISVGDVVLVKTLIGDEIVGKLTETNSDTISLSKPFLMQVQMKSASEAGLAFVPFIVAAADINNVVLSRTGLLVGPSAVREDIKHEYISMTSPIAMPPKSGLIL